MTEELEPYTAKRPRGRPRKGVKHSYAIGVLDFYEGEDDDLIQMFEAIPNGKLRSAIKQAFRYGGKKINVADLSDDDELAQAAKNFLT